MTTYVYHAAREEDVDDYTKGYIGVSIDPARRQKEHERVNLNPHLRNALDKYCDIEWHVIFEGTDEECYAKEQELRPEINIGWNIAIGGGKPPSPKGKPHCVGNLPKEKRRKGYKHSEETLRKMREIGRDNAANLSEARKGVGNPNFGKYGIENPNFKKYYVTPEGKFESAYSAAKTNSVSRTTVQKRCKEGAVIKRCKQAPKGSAGLLWVDLGWSSVEA